MKSLDKGSVSVSGNTVTPITPIPTKQRKLVVETSDSKVINTLRFEDKEVNAMLDMAVELSNKCSGEYRDLAHYILLYAFCIGSDESAIEQNTLVDGLYCQYAKATGKETDFAHMIQNATDQYVENVIRECICVCAGLTKARTPNDLNEWLIRSVHIAIQLIDLESGISEDAKEEAKSMIAFTVIDTIEIQKRN